MIAQLTTNQRSPDLHSFPNGKPSNRTPHEAPSQYLVHSYQYPTRLALMQALETDPALHRTLDRLRSCATDAWIDYSPSTLGYRVRANHCGLRCCPRCQRLYSHLVADHIEDFLGKPSKNTAKFITLTLRHSHAPLLTQLRNLQQAFRRLRQRKLWRSAVTSGYAVIEITWNQAAKQWHPHLHIVAFSDFIPQHALATAWEAVTRGSMIVDIRIVRSTARTSSYLAKYLGKPPEFPNPAHHHDELREYVTALAKTHLVIRFGGAPPVPKRSTQPAWDPGDWEPIGKVNYLFFQAKAGNPNAQAALTAAFHVPLNLLLRLANQQSHPPVEQPP